MNFVISPTVFDHHPDVAVGIVIATRINNTGSHPEITELLRAEESKIRSQFDLETFREHPQLAALQEVHRSFGSNPNKFPPSIQALIKRILKGGELPSINPIVDIYNIISLRYVVCAGAEDTDTCEGDIQLAFADGSEHFLPLGEESEDLPKEGELVYKDDIGVICRKLNWREGDRTKITSETKNAVIVVEGFPPLASEELQNALNDLSSLVEKYCGAQTRIEILAKGGGKCGI